MSEYIYKNPIDNGFKQFKLTKQQHNKLFIYRQIKWHDKYEYYYNDRCILLHKFDNWKFMVLSTILFPLLLSMTVIMEGLKNIKEIIIEYKELYNQKKYGSFSTDSIEKNSDIYNEVMKLIL